MDDNYFLICCLCFNTTIVRRYCRKPSVVIKHSGLDESGDSNASEDLNFPVSANGQLDISRLPKGRH